MDPVKEYAMLCEVVGNLVFRKGDLEAELHDIKTKLEAAVKAREAIRKKLDDASTVQNPSSNG